jgi:hypothetical protein
MLMSYVILESLWCMKKMMSKAKQNYYIHVIQLLINKKTKVMNQETTTNATATAKRGRPVINNSARQAKLAAREARIALGGSVERGRPSNPESKRQARLAAQAARAAAGVAIKVGRPKAVKAEAVAA